MVFWRNIHVVTNFFAVLTRPVNFFKVKIERKCTVISLLLKLHPNGISCVLIWCLLVLLHPDAVVEGHQGAGLHVPGGEGALSAALYAALPDLHQLLLVRVSPSQGESHLVPGAGQITVLPGMLKQIGPKYQILAFMGQFKLI